MTSSERSPGCVAWLHKLRKYVLRAQKKLFRPVFLFILAFLLAIAPSTASYAAVEDFIDEFAANNIMFYNPEEHDCSQARGGDGTIYGETIGEKIWVGLTTIVGLTDEQAAGVMGNMQHESNFNPAQHEIALLNKHQPGFNLGANAGVSYGLGLIQWSYGRRIAMYNYVQQKDAGLLQYFNDYSKYSVGYTINGDKFLELAGDSVANELIQYELEFLRDELQNTSRYKKIFDQTTVYDAAKYFLENIEIPKNPYISSHPERATDAQKYYDEFHGKQISGGTTSVATPAGSGSFTKYTDLTDSQLWDLVEVAKGENGVNLTGIKNELSLMANLFEKNGKKYGSGGSGLVNYISTSGWFAKTTASKINGKHDIDVSSEELAAARDILINGARVLPTQIVEHDCIKCGAGVDHAYNDDSRSVDLINDYSQWQSGKTILVQDSGNLHGEWVFYGWMGGSAGVGDPMGYFADNPPDDISVGAADTTGATVTVIGDSITEMSSDELKELLPDVEIDAVSGRGWKTGLKQLNNMSLRDNVVFAHGSNNHDPALAQADIDALISAVGNRNLYLITNYSTEDEKAQAYEVNNALFKTAAETHSNVHIIDWASSASSDSSKYMAPDQLHPSSAGEKLWAELVANAVKGASVVDQCGTPSGDVSTLQEYVLKYAWPDHHWAPYMDMKPDYQEATKKRSQNGEYIGGYGGVDCGGFVTTLLNESGYEPEYNYGGKIKNGAGNTTNQLAWAKEHWTLLNASLTTEVDTSILQAGDVAVYEGHTFIYVGEIPGFNSNIASASYGQRAPMAGLESLTYDSTHRAIVKWFRKGAK